jgi:hypothetical protein
MYFPKNTVSPPHRSSRLSSWVISLIIEERRPVGGKGPAAGQGRGEVQPLFHCRLEGKAGRKAAVDIAVITNIILGIVGKSE